MKYYNSFSTLDELVQYLRNEELAIPVSQNPEETLRRMVTISDESTLRNSIAIQPMEGCDATSDGAPGELTLRRYDKFAASGAGLIWIEATAVLEEARANPHQLFITEKNVDQFAALAEEIKTTAYREFGWAPKIILQATHSGRFSKPYGEPKPIISYQNPILSRNMQGKTEHIITDDELKSVEEAMGRTAALAQRAGFDGMDIKSCHCYLFSEILSAYDRPGEYGGSFENRTRLLRNSIRAACSRTNGNFLVTTRLNVYDGFAYPFGFGVAKDHDGADLSEAKRLVHELYEKEGISLVNITIGTPYVNPHVNRPANYQTGGVDENPFVGVSRMLGCIREIKSACPEVKIVGSGLSYPGRFAGNVAAGALEAGYFDIAGFGRMAFANADFPKQMLNGTIVPNHCCIACGKCTELMRMGSGTGCVVRDPIYTKLYQEVASRQKRQAI